MPKRKTSAKQTSFFFCARALAAHWRKQWQGHCFRGFCYGTGLQQPQPQSQLLPQLLLQPQLLPPLLPQPQQKIRIRIRMIHRQPQPLPPPQPLLPQHILDSPHLFYLAHTMWGAAKWFPAGHLFFR